MKYLPDTNAFSAYLAGRSARLTGLMIQAAQRNDLLLSAMVLAELEFGAEKARIQMKVSKFSRQVALLRQQFKVEPLDDAFTHTYAQIRCTLESQGRKIGDRDTIIAAHALALKATLVTSNVDQFTRVAGLAVENWL